jgi:hypothetical protein
MTRGIVIVPQAMILVHNVLRILFVPVAKHITPIGKNAGTLAFLAVGTRKPRGAFPRNVYVIPRTLSQAIPGMRYNMASKVLFPLGQPTRVAINFTNTWAILSYRAQLEYKAADLWIGIYWDKKPIRETQGDGFIEQAHDLNIWICLVPMFPIHISALLTKGRINK